jgi:hypothetical protein
VRGVFVGLYPAPEGFAESAYPASLVELTALGATHVAFAVHWAQPDVSANRIAASASISARDADVRAAIRAAHAAGLEVMLFPIVHVERRAMGQWRGTLAPDDVDAWWSSYERFITHYARIAADERVEVFSVGSELGTTELWRDRWFSLVSSVREHYHGPLVYSANWDHFEHVSFWSRIDYVGVTGYFELTRDRDAGVEALASAWRRHRQVLVGQARRAGKPLWLTEVGYQSRDGAATNPWNYSTDDPVDVEEQRRAYQAFADAWDDSPLDGVFFWTYNGPGGPRDTDYTWRAKPAAGVLRRWFAGKPASAGWSPVRAGASRGD